MQIISSSGDPSMVTTAVQIYAKSVSGTLQLFAEDSAGNVYQLTPGLGARQIINEMWAQNAVAASQTSVALSAAVSQLFDSWTTFRAGSCIAMRTKFDTAVTAGTLTATVTKNGSAGTLAVASTSVSNQNGGVATQAAGSADSFVAGDTLGIQITTNGAFLPVTLNMEAYLEIYANNVA